MPSRLYDGFRAGGGEITPRSVLRVLLVTGDTQLWRGLPTAPPAPNEGLS